AESGDFLRGGTSSSLAAGTLLEVDSEVGFYCFLSCAAGAIAEDEVVLRGIGECWRHGEIDLLRGSAVGREKRICGSPAEEIRVLLFVEQEKVHLNLWFSCAKRLIGSSQLRARRMRGQFEREFNDIRHRECFVQKRRAGSDWRIPYVIFSRRLV